MKQRRKQLLALLLVFSLLTPQSVMAQDMQPDAKTAEITETESALEKDGDERKKNSRPIKQKSHLLRNLLRSRSPLHQKNQRKRFRNRSFPRRCRPQKRK